MGTTNVDRHRQGHQAFVEGDMETLQGLIAKDTVWHAPGQNLLSGDHEGLGSVLGLFEQMGQLTGGNVKVEAHAYMSNGSYTAALTELTATRGEETLEMRGCEVCKWKEGQVVEEWIFVEDQQAYDEFWS